MKLVFCGTPRFAVPTLEALIAAGHEIALVVSQPDRPVGRNQKFTAPPVKQTALASGLSFTQPEKIRNNLEFRAQLEAIAPEAIVVVAYGRIIPPWMLALPRLGCINLHGSLLPKYRGAAPSSGPWPWAMPLPEHHHAAGRRPRYRPDSPPADYRNRPGTNRGRPFCRIGRCRRSAHG